MGLGSTSLLGVLLVLVASVFVVNSWTFVSRLSRNAFTPAIPRAVDPRYPLVEDAALAEDITVVVGTKDTVSPTIAQLQHLAEALPHGVRVLYTFPQPLWEDSSDYVAKLKAAAGPLGKRVRFVPVPSFCNPFEAWLQAVPLVRTKYTLLMHNDVFLLDKRGHFLSELYGALEAHPEHAVAAPQIYETELPGLLTTHLFNTNLHLRLNHAGVAFMSHEVDLAMGLSREPNDFEERLNSNFLEDHVFLARTASVDGAFIDPKAAFTLEYVDLQLNMIRQNLTQLYVPSARAEFRLWEVGWQDVPYFVRRRSEEQARQTKQHLERKWGVEFPNTGFCNFVKFSIIRHVGLSWSELPSRWVEQVQPSARTHGPATLRTHGPPCDCPCRDLIARSACELCPRAHRELCALSGRSLLGLVRDGRLQPPQRAYSGPSAHGAARRRPRRRPRRRERGRLQHECRPPPHGAEGARFHCQGASERLGALGHRRAPPLRADGGAARDPLSGADHEPRMVSGSPLTRSSDALL